MRADLGCGRLCLTGTLERKILVDGWYFVHGFFGNAHGNHERQIKRKKEKKNREHKTVDKDLKKKKVSSTQHKISSFFE